jgi:hypothetical protein
MTVLISNEESDSDRIEKALEVAFRCGQIDGDHHKLWVIDQMVRALTGNGYDAWVKEYQGELTEDDEYGYVWETGIAP